MGDTLCTNAVKQSKKDEKY